MYNSNKYPRSVFRELQEFPYSKKNNRSIFNSTKSSEDFVQRLKLYKKLSIHGGCVNCICWNDRGNKILSGSDDQHLVITDPFSYQVLTKYRTNHRANIFSAKFLPDTGDSSIVSCCGDGSILYTDITRVEDTQDCLFNCHSGTTYDVVTVPNDPHVFLSCGEDYTVRSFDLRIKNKCNKPKCKEDVIIECHRAVTALTVNSLLPYQLAIGCADSTARIYDRRMIHGFDCRLSATDAFIKPGLEKKPYRITSLNFSPEGHDLLVSYSSEHVYLFGVRNSKETVYSTESICDSDEDDQESNWIGKERDKVNKDSSSDNNAPVRRLRLRGDWSDTGPDARPHSNQLSSANQSQGGRRVVQGGLIQRMTDVLSRMLNDPLTRAALSQGGESEPSDQMRIEEGLGEYLDINGRRRTSESSVAQASSSPEEHSNNVENAPSDSLSRETDDRSTEEHSYSLANVPIDSVIIEPDDSSAGEHSTTLTTVPSDTGIVKSNNLNLSDNSNSLESVPSHNVEGEPRDTPMTEVSNIIDPEPNTSMTENNYMLFESNHVSVNESCNVISSNDINMEDNHMDTFMESGPTVQQQSVLRESSFENQNYSEDVSNSQINNIQADQTSHLAEQYDDDDYCDHRPVKRVKEETQNQSILNNFSQPLSESSGQSGQGGTESVSSPNDQSCFSELTKTPIMTAFHSSGSTLSILMSGSHSYHNIPSSSSSTSLTSQELTSSSDQQLNNSSQTCDEPMNQQAEPSTSNTMQDESVESRIPNPDASPGSNDLSEELSTMFKGFKKYGKKPMVNLVYSMRGSTSSTISMTVDDQQASSSTTIQPPVTEGEYEQTHNNSSTFNQLKDSSSVSEEAVLNQSENYSSNEQEQCSTNVEEDSAMMSNSSESRVDDRVQMTTEESEANSLISQPSTSSYSSNRFTDNIEKEMWKDMKSFKGDSMKDDTVRLKKANIRMTYTGHRNARTMIKESTFWGNDYVMSGSDCGHVFIWTRDTGRLVMTLQADNHVVNCLQPHPTLPILATSGIDYDVKLWAPTATEPYFDYPAAQELMSRNAIMLEETKDTITVPASFMIRMLACLNQLRRGRPRTVPRTQRRRVPLDE